MSNSFQLQQMLLNQIPVPSKLLTSYTTLGLTELELVVILQIHRFAYENNFFPTPNELTGCLSIEETTCSKVLRHLIQKQYLSIEQMENSQHQLSEVYSLEPLWKKLYAPQESPKEENSEGALFVMFEQEFGRPLSPFEIEMVNTWLDEDKLSTVLIKAGLREAVLMGKLNFKYIDRILREWKRKGIHSVEQARQASKSFHKSRSSQEETTMDRDTSFYYNWLDGEGE
ncbi:DnaD domain-containing protein [Virgibacillus sp. 179-BFC.A HS]|uniref:DnaD domain-containing protein n=1 Tax=Tigheibacillus jepli TaxID=3035914 RepID=A0ABU5CHB3_9BACI|nr:DnaD domain-containing protein [Virgibacillus sp. 179-BFC.A HS]MDY0405726.1 DnaD domain-containing protein [Virgibacillus sp. 179-BFC.A HS]